MSARIRVSILVKAWNESSKISRCLTAAVREAADVGGEVILADSLSSDDTVEIAKRFPVRIVQLKDPLDRSCGAATQLGYDFARGDHLFITDGDMQLKAGFLEAGLQYLKENPAVGGVGGLLIDTQVHTSSAKRRVAAYGRIRGIVSVAYLGGGGLYRRSAIESVGYLGNRWLKACEEAELGLRLRSEGWRLVRLPIPAVEHNGHNESSKEALLRLWRNGRIAAHGVFLRYALGKPWWWSGVRIAWFVLVAPALHAVTLVIIAAMHAGGITGIVPAVNVFALLWGTVFVTLWAKKRSFRDGLLSIASWHICALAALPAFLRRTRDPHEPIPARELTA